MLPLVSCILPTYNRRAFMTDAIACWEAQTYQSRELVILDDGEDVIADLVPLSDPRIRYCRCSRLTIGAKRNLACHQAQGELIAHWDSDDWSHPARLAEQVNLLIQADVALVGYHSITFHDIRNEQRWEYNGEPNYACGTSLMYKREFWQAHPFPDLQIAEDNAMVAAAQGRMLAVDGRHRITAREHDGVSCPRQFEWGDSYKRIA